MGKRGSGKRLTDRERIEIIECFENDPEMTNSKCARNYGVSAAAISRLLKRSVDIKKRYLQGSLRERDQRRRGGIAKHAAFEDELLAWIMDLKERKIKVSSSLVQEKAKSISQKHNLGPFKASYGWYFRFCKRHGLIGRGAALEIDFQDRPKLQTHQEFAPSLIGSRNDIPISCLNEVGTLTMSSEIAYHSSKYREENGPNAISIRTLGVHEDLTQYPYHFAVCHSMGNIARFMEIVEQIDQNDGDINACMQLSVPKDTASFISAPSVTPISVASTINESRHNEESGSLTEDKTALYIEDGDLDKPITPTETLGKQEGALYISPQLSDRPRSFIQQPELSAVMYASYLGYVEIVKYFLKREDVVKTEKKYITIQRAQKNEAEWMQSSPIIRKESNCIALETDERIQQISGHAESETLARETTILDEGFI
uniref:Uncharacterized protein AlNc14C55G4203 n=1 Tax=Albugo laibachii Nc14 TaxID=890382 RepID=F0WC16_9STRA|nr:conserved hypothetical protein [Albugo laibachii Nc14]|eukprot:CCA18697.1 conserved hypothetical protein [Albugo laibachii Nc14]